MDKILIENTTPYNILIPQIIEKAKEIKQDCVDYVLDDLSVSDFQIDKDHNVTFRYFMDNNCTLETTEHSRAQLCRFLGLPYMAYYVPQMNNGTFTSQRQNLIKENVEKLSTFYRKGLFMRRYKDKLRAVLTPKYKAYDSDEIIQDIDAVIEKKYPGWKTDSLAVAGYLNDEESLHLRLIDKTPIDCGTEQVYCGLVIRSSDVGASSIAIDYYVYQEMNSKGICITSNDTFKDNELKQRHIGKINSKEIQERIMEAVEDFHPACENARNYIENAANFDITDTGLYNEKSFHGKAMIRELGLNNNQKQAEELMKALREQPKTLWGYINGIVNFAATLKINERQRLEAKAGRILFHPEDYGFMII